MEERTFAKIGRIEAIRLLFEDSGFTPFGEPLSFPSSEGSRSVTASRLFLEGMDFNLEYFPLKHLGYKCVCAVAGEIYGAFAHPRTLSLTLGVSAKLDFEQVREFWDGVVVAAKEHSFTSLSLDLGPSRNGLAVSVSGSGECRGVNAGARPEARSKDLLCVTGSLGAAYLGQQVLERKRDELEKYKMLVASYLKPEIAPDFVDSMEKSALVPSHVYFISRGLADAVLMLSRDSGLGVKIYADKIPFEGNSFALGKELDIDPVSAAMNGGDDYRLLFTIPISRYSDFRRDFQVFDIIGHLALPEAGTVLVTPDGIEHAISAPGW